MGLISEDLEKPHMKQERKLRFKEFVTAQKKGMRHAALMCEGIRDYYGSIKFRREMRGGVWVIDGGDYPNLLIFAKRASAESYAKELKEILKNNGRSGSDVWAERVCIRTSTPYASFKLKKPAISYSTEERYIIRMDVC